MRDVGETNYFVVDVDSTKHFPENRLIACRSERIRWRKGDRQRINWSSNIKKPNLIFVEIVDGKISHIAKFEFDIL